MWSPETWVELLALVGQAEETPSLDFKKLVSTNSREVAKDIAAMTVDGGVILYGVDEDKTTRVASNLSKVALAGQEERLRQIANSNIRPAPAFHVVAITEAEGDSHGVLAVIIPPSPLAPHEVDGRFPRRDGTTTAYLTEPEIERLYRLRRHAGGVAPEPTELLDLAAELPGVTDAQERTVTRHVGLLRVAAQIAGDTRHPSDPWLSDALSDANRRAETSLANRGATARPFLLSRLETDGWQPDGVRGWATGWASSDAATLYRDLTTAGVFRYPAQVLLQVTFPLRVASDRAEGFLDYDCAYEFLVVRELLAALLWVGQWGSDYEAAGSMHLGVLLSGFKDAAPYWQCRARPGMDVSHMAAAPHGIVAASSVAPIQLIQTPGRVARDLIDRWLVPFYRGPDLYDIALN